MSRRMARFDFLSFFSGKKNSVRRRSGGGRNQAREQAPDPWLVEPMERRILLAGDVTISLTGESTIHDETPGLQNTPPNLDATTDDNGNDIALSEVPAVLDTTGAIGAALSGYDGSTGADAFTIDAGGATINNLALTDANGDPLDGDDSGLDTVDGNNILLFTDSANDNLVVGVEEGTGDTVFAIYLEENADLTAGKFWTVQYEAIAHPDSPNNYDEPLDLTNTLFVTASRDLEFDLTNAPSGQNLFIMFGDGSISDDPSEVGIIATGKNPLDQSANPGTTITAGDTVNTSQGGGDTTFGVNNQMIDEGEGIYFTFVTGPEPTYTVPNLDQNEADIEGNILFDDVLDAKAAEFEVVQLQSGKTAVLKISAFSTTANQGDGFIDANGLTGNTPVNILSVEVDDFDGGGEINIIDNGDGTFNIEGVEAGDTIRYFTDGDHNRVLIENDGDGTGQDSAAFDIGGFKLIQADATTAEVGSTVHWEDDGPAIDIDLSGAEVRTDDRALTGGSGLPDAGTSTDTDTLTTVVTNNPGTDGEDSLVYSLGVSAAGVDSGVDDVATGNSIFLYLEGGEVVGRVGSSETVADPAGAEAFRVAVDATSGAVTLDQLRAIEHGTSETNAGASDYYTTDVETLIADSVTLTATLTDNDVDVATDTANIGDKIGFTDDGPQIDIDLSGAELRTDDRSLTGGSGLPDAGTSTDTDTLTTVVTNNPGADAEDSLVYTLGVSAAGVDSGVDDVATGNSIFLYLEGGEVVGRVGSSETVADPAGAEAFRVAVDGTSGAVTQTQSLAIEHGTPETNAGATDYYTTDVETLIASAVTLTATLTDGDVDKATDTVNIGDKIGFTDDGPQIDIELSGLELRTDDRSLTGGSGLPDAGTSTDTDALTTVVLANTTDGADGQESLVYTLDVKSAGEDSGVDDVATGNSIFLYLESGVVVGRVGSDEVTPNPAGDIAFQISVDATSGAVTLNQLRAIEHGTPETNTEAPDYYTTDVETLIADSVTLTATLTDNDVDVATDTVNVGDKIGFTDDGPQIDIDLSGAELRTDDRSLTGGSGLPDAGTNADTDTLTTVVLANTTDGADGQESLVYTLDVKSAGEDSGVDDVATGNSIFLYLESGVVVGRVGSDEVTPDPLGDIAFQISVDGTSGAVTLDQLRAIEHGTPETNAGAPDYYTTDVETLIADSVTLTATLTDNDVDVATDTVNIGDKIGFTDDGPQIDIELSGVELRTDDRSLTGGSGLPDAGTSTDTDALTTVVTNNPGADAEDSLVYSLGVSAAGVDSGVDDVATGNSIFLYLEGGEVVGRVGTSETVADPAGAEAFRVSVDSSTGAVTLTQARAIEHGVAEADAGAPDYYTTDVETLAASAVTLTATLTDGDVDVATDTANIGDKIGFTDDGPDVEFSNLVGTVTVNPQIGFWTETVGADQPGTVVVTAGSTFEMVTADGVSSTGSVVFDSATGTGSLTADLDNDPGNGDESVTFSLIVNPDGTYVFTLDEVIVPVVTLSTDEGQLPAGGPDPVQTLAFVDTEIVFFAVDAATAEDVSDPIVPAIVVGEPDNPGDPNTETTEQALEDRALPPLGDGTFPFIREEILMNVSTSGIGVNNNVLQGEDLAGDDPGTINSFDSGAFDESFVINPEPLASEIKVFISKTAGGFLPPNADGTLNGTQAKTDYLYYNIYDEFGNNAGPILVTSEVVFDEADEAAGGTGENLWSFTVDIDDVIVPGESIDAIQFTMGFGNIKIPKIEIVVEGGAPPNDILLDFSATLTDADGDSASTNFAIDLLGNDVDQAFDYTLVDAGDPNDDGFNVNVLQDPTSYLVQGFVSGSDQLYLLNGSGFTLEVGSDFGAGDPLVNDSRITVDGVTIIVEDATLAPADITEETTQAAEEGLNFLAEDESEPVEEDDGLVMLLV